MCRNIRTLHNFDPPATADEVHAAALQYVRKISGFTKASRANQPGFDAAVAAVTAASLELLGELTAAAPPRIVTPRRPKPGRGQLSATRPDAGRGQAAR